MIPIQKHLKDCKRVFTGRTDLVISEKEEIEDPTYTASFAFDNQEIEPGKDEPEIINKSPPEPPEQSEVEPDQLEDLNEANREELQEIAQEVLH